MIDNKLKKKGFIISPQLFDNKEIKLLRKICEKYMDIYDPEYPEELFEILNNKNIYEFIIKSLGENILWTGNYEFKHENKYYAYNLHHDAKGGIPKISPIDYKNIPKEFLSNYRSERDYHLFSYPVYRLFIYLNDYRNSSGGTKLKSFSHKRYLINEINKIRQIRNMDIPFFANVNPKVNAGQGVLFNARLYHSGFFIRYKSFPNIAMPTFIDNHVKRLLLNRKFERYINKFILPFPINRWTIAIDFAYESLYSLLYSTDRYYCGNPAIKNLVNKSRREKIEKIVSPLKIMPLNFSPIK